MIRDTLRRAGSQVRTDLREDPYLLYLLLAAAVVMLFFIWHRLPNFATRDERWRVIDFYEVVAFSLEEGSFESIKEGVGFGRSYGATMLLYGLVTLPVVVYAALTDRLAVFEPMPDLGWGGFQLWELWQTAPAWVWSSSVLAARLVNALMAVGCVYLLYRIGTTLRDRWTGRLAAVLMTFCWGLIMLAHEAGEDVPALFAMVLTVYFGVAYLQSGESRYFLWGTAAGGLAIAFKPTAGVGGIVLGTAHLLWMRREALARTDVPTRRFAGMVSVPVPSARQLLDLARPGMLLYGLLVAATVLFATYPGILVEAPVAVLGLVVLVFSIGYLWRLRPLLPPAVETQANGGSRPELSLRERDWLARPAVVALSLLAVGGAVVVLAKLGSLEGGIEALENRLDRGGSNKNQKTHGWLVRSTEWWLLRGYLNGLGWPLFVAGIASVGAAFARVRERSVETDGVLASLVGVAVVLFVYSSWSYIRTHHLLLTFPFIVVLVAVAGARLRARRPRIGRPIVAVLVLTTALYGGVGTLGYATQPHDEVVGYLNANAGPNATIESYATHDPQEAAVPHWMNVSRPGRADWLGTRERCPDYVQLTYQHALMYFAPENHSFWSGKYHSNDLYREHFTELLTDDSDAYEIVDTYGRKPFFLRGGTQTEYDLNLEDGTPVSRNWNLYRAGIFPRTIQYGDPQDFGVYEYIILLERTGSCETGSTS